MGAEMGGNATIEEDGEMLVFDDACSFLDQVWTTVADDLGLFDIPVVGNIVAAVIDFVWGLFGCDFW